jgi:hypothetical protein
LAWLDGYSVELIVAPELSCAVNERICVVLERKRCDGAPGVKLLGVPIFYRKTFGRIAMSQVPHTPSQKAGTAQSARLRGGWS